MNRMYLVATKPKTIAVTLDTSTGVTIHEDKTGQGGANWKEILNSSNYPNNTPLPIANSEKHNLIQTNSTLSVAINATDYVKYEQPDPKNPWPQPPPPPPTNVANVKCHMFFEQRHEIKISPTVTCDVGILVSDDQGNTWLGEVVVKNHPAGTDLNLAAHEGKTIYIYMQSVNAEVNLLDVNCFYYMRGDNNAQWRNPLEPPPPVGFISLRKTESETNTVSITIGSSTITVTNTERDPRSKSSS